MKRRAILKCPSGTGCGVSDAAGEKGFEQQEMDECRQNLVQIVPDASYTVPKGRLTIAHGFSRG